MLKVTKQVDVVCSAIGIKEAMIMCPITSWICDGIKRNSCITISLSEEQCVAIGKILGELGFVSEMGENPLELIREFEAKNLSPSLDSLAHLKSDITAQCPE